MSEKFDCSETAAHSSLHARLLGLLKTYSENRYLKIFWRPWMRIIIYSWKLSLVPLALHYTTNYLSSHMPPPDHWLKIAEMQINAVSPNTCLVSCHNVTLSYHIITWCLPSGPPYLLDTYWGVNLSLLSSLYSNPVASISIQYQITVGQDVSVTVSLCDRMTMTVWQCDSVKDDLLRWWCPLPLWPQRPSARSPS